MSFQARRTACRTRDEILRRWSSCQCVAEEVRAPSCLPTRDEAECAFWTLEIYGKDYFIELLITRCGAEPEIITRNRSIAAHKQNEIAERDCSPDPDVGEDFYRERMGL